AEDKAKAPEVKEAEAPEAGETEAPTAEVEAPTYHPIMNFVQGQTKKPNKKLGAKEAIAREIVGTDIKNYDSLIVTITDEVTKINKQLADKELSSERRKKLSEYKTNLTHAYNSVIKHQQNRKKSQIENVYDPLIKKAEEAAKRKSKTDIALEEADNVTVEREAPSAEEEGGAIESTQPPVAKSTGKTVKVSEVEKARKEKVSDITKEKSDYFGEDEKGKFINTTRNFRIEIKDDKDIPAEHALKEVGDVVYMFGAPNQKFKIIEIDSKNGKYYYEEVSPKDKPSYFTPTIHSMGLGESKPVLELIAIIEEIAPGTGVQFVSKIAENPQAVGAYFDEIIRLTGKGMTDLVATHEAVHHFMQKLIPQEDYDFLVAKFGSEETIVDIATEYYLNKKAKGLTGKVLQTIKEFWNKIKRLVGKGDRVTEILSKIGKAKERIEGRTISNAVMYKAANPDDNVKDIEATKEADPNNEENIQSDDKEFDYEQADNSESYVAQLTGLDIFHREEGRTLLRLYATRSEDSQEFRDSIEKYITREFPKNVKNIAVEGAKLKEYENWSQRYWVVNKSLFYNAVDVNGLSDINKRIVYNYVDGVISPDMENINLVTKKNYPFMTTRSFVDDDAIAGTAMRPLYIDDDRAFKTRQAMFGEAPRLVETRIDPTIVNQQMTHQDPNKFFVHIIGDKGKIVMSQVPGWIQNYSTQELVDLYSGLVKDGRITQEQLNGLLKEIKDKKIKNGYHKGYARILFIESIKWEGYLAEEADIAGNKDPIRVTADRLKIDFADGTTPFGMGSSKVMIAPSDAIVRFPNGVEVPMATYDGYLITSMDFFNRLGKATGYSGRPLSMAKTFIRHRDADGNYIGMKMLQMSTLEGMEIFDKKGNRIAYEEGGMLFDNVGDEFHLLGTDNEDKMTHGAFGKENWGNIAEVDIAETDVRVKTLESKYSKHEPIAFTQWYEQLFHNGYREKYEVFEKAILEYMDRVMIPYQTLLGETVHDLEKRASLVKKKSIEGVYSSELQQIIDMSEDGLLLPLPGYQNLIEGYIKNRLIVNGVNQMRKSGGGTELF
ncbi:MAG: hypothetical protein DRN30_05740, partial [Thermoplasmata archaeon]